MINLQRGFIAPLLLALLATLLIGGGAYVYMQKNQTNQPVVVDSTVQRPVAENILPDTYTNLTDYEKSLVNRMSSIVGPYNGYIPKYYDDKTAVFVVAPPKGGGASFGVYDIQTLKKLSTLQFSAFGNYVESGSYIIGTGLVSAGLEDTIGEENFIFYKKGATDFQVIPNSTLPASKTYYGSETYAKGNGDMGSNNYDFTFDEPTKTLTASVFKRVNGSATNTKIRTVKFVLP